MTGFGPSAVMEVEELLDQLLYSSKRYSHTRAWY